MPRICHLFDRSSDWEQRVGVSGLLDRLPPDRYENHLATIHPVAANLFRSAESCMESSSERSHSFPLAKGGKRGGEAHSAVDFPGKQRPNVLPHIAGFVAFSGPAVSRYVAERKIDLIHAWGVDAAAAARAVSDTPLLVQLFDPLVATNEVKRLRVLARPVGLAVACSCELVRRRLVEGGFPRELTVVIRPSVDFSAINRARRSSLREDLGLSWADHVIIVPEPVSLAAGSFEAVHAACLRNHLTGGLRVIVPGDSAERRRIERFIARLPVPNPIVTDGRHTCFEQLVSISDTMLITPSGDISTTSIAWAMAAGVTVLGTATYAVSEMIANKVNGFLFKFDRSQAMGSSISKLLQDRASHEQVKEAARGQAYEVFSLRRYTEQTMQLYDNLLSGRSPDHAIADSAFDV